MATLTHWPALGQNVAIGTLFDARKDQFLPDSLLNPHLPEAAFQIVVQNKANVAVSYGDGYRKRLEGIGMHPILAGSIMADSVRCGGSGRYLAEAHEGCTLHAALYHTVNTCNQELNPDFRELRNYLESGTITSPDATHMVAGIEWGSKSVISVRVYCDSDAAKASANPHLQVVFAALMSAVEALNGTVPSITGDWASSEMGFPTEITAYSEMLEEDDGILLADLQEAYEFLKMMPLHVRSVNEGKGWPISYSLLPVETLSFILGVQAPHKRQVSYPPPDILDSCLCLFDEYLVCERRLEDRQSKLLANIQYLSPDALHEADDRLVTVRNAKQRFRDDFARILSSVKSGGVDPSILRQIHDNYQRGEYSPQCIGDDCAPGCDILEFIHTAVSSGAIYIGHNGAKLESVIPASPTSVAYVFYFSPAAMKDEGTWNSNLDLLFELLQDRSPNTVVALVDCEATSRKIDKAHIAQYQEGREVIEDYLEHRLFMADKCFAEYNETTLETEDIKPPIQRRHITIPCPGIKCSVAKIHEWLCPRCMAPVEYGYSDQYIYCGCGRSLYDNYVFKCSSEIHGPHYAPYDLQKLLDLLSGLAQTNYLNILILGETGVGKSTFINAMVNYLEFDTLDEAIAAEKLNYIIPCSFSTQIMDRTDPSRPIEEKRIKIGARDDERDGSEGDSATQKTTVYPVTFHSGESTLTVRLIDTPGIGDSRGVDADRQNMSDILSTLNGYESVHGILILLKSNNARLTITFRYCIKELLTHLHHNAAANMAFGFTNTRISNYTPGDTYLPLKKLLGQHQDVGLLLETPTTYCFDSESFRYLAAYKNGVIMPNKVDFDRSWSQSRDETIRLITRFQGIAPHEVKNTISLNGARQLISELTKPLAEISQLINTNIQLVEDQVNALKVTWIKGDELRNLLHVQKVQMQPDQLDMPRTVCGDRECVEVRDDGKGQNNMVIIYKQHCHPVCYLEGIQTDVMAPPNLTSCAAFHGAEKCMRCGHHWQQHLHVLYELHEETVTMVDDGIQQQLASHADDITLKQTAIMKKEELVAEYRQEREVIRDAAAKFCVFLKNNSLVPYNDALIAYLDFLIKEEQAKVQAGGNSKRLLSLTEERYKHQEAIEVITRNTDSDAVRNDFSDGGIDHMVHDLYNLKYFGDNLKKLKQGIATAHQTTYRERPYTVKRRNRSRHMSRVVKIDPADRNSRHQPKRPASSSGSIADGITSFIKKKHKMISAMMSPIRDLGNSSDS